MSTVLVTGATGFIGRRLVPALVDAGHTVRAMTRRPEDYAGVGEPVGADVDDPASLAAALDGVEVAVYLVNSLDDPDFQHKDAQAARNFSRAAADAGVRQIVYLGGLGADDHDLSAHLRSRREVEGLLGADGVPVTTLRAAIVVGHGGISWEITRQLVKNLPAMVVPRWAHTRSQPIGIDDVVRYLAGVVDRDEALGRVFEIGGPEQLTAAVTNCRRRSSSVLSRWSRGTTVHSERRSQSSMAITLDMADARTLVVLRPRVHAQERSGIRPMSARLRVNQGELQDQRPEKPAAE